MDKTSEFTQKLKNGRKNTRVTATPKKSIRKQIDYTLVKSTYLIGELDLERYKRKRGNNINPG